MALSSRGLVTNSDGHVDELDCRPSDAFNLALLAGAPVALAQALLDEAREGALVFDHQDPHLTHHFIRCCRPNPAGKALLNDPLPRS